MCPFHLFFFLNNQMTLNISCMKKKTLYKHLIDITLLYIVHISLMRSEEKNSILYIVHISLKRSEEKNSIS